MPQNILFPVYFLTSMATGKYFFFFSFFIFSPCCATCRILVSRLGIKSVPPALEAQSLNHWTTREVSGNVSLKKKKLFMTVLYLYCCSWAFSSCREWGLLSSFSMQASHCGGFSCCKARDLRLEGSVVGAHELSCPRGLWVLSCQTKDQTRVPCIGKWILNH